MRTLLKALLILMCTASIGACNPLKVTDTADPNFNSDHFSFSDYKNGPEFIAAFQKLFPVGTSREFVDRVLVKAGKAELIAEGIRGPEQYNVVVYREPEIKLDTDQQFAPGPIHYFIFDRDSLLINAYSRYQIIHDEGQIKLQDIINEEMEKDLKVYAPSNKIIDPASPGFDPDRFRFDDYFGRTPLIDAFEKLFPVGTPKEFVDRVLATAGGAKSLETKALPGVWHYSQPRRIGLPAGPVHTFIFDQNEEIANIHAFNTDYLYPQNVTLEQVEALKDADEVDPNTTFNPDDFSFQRDWDAKEAQFRKLFPVGTPKSFVDRVLVDVGGASILPLPYVPEPWQAWRYDEPQRPLIPGAPAHIFIFDAQDKVVNIYFGVGFDLYPENVTYRGLYEEYYRKRDANGD